MKSLLLLLTITFFGKTSLRSENIYNINATAVSIDKLPQYEFDTNKNSLAFERQYPITTKQQNGDKEYIFDFNMFRAGIVLMLVGSVAGFVGFILLIMALVRRGKLNKKIRELKAEVRGLDRREVYRYVNLHEIQAGLEHKEKKLMAKNSEQAKKQLEETRAKMEALKKEIDIIRAILPK